jgi:rubrerythrin
MEKTTTLGANRTGMQMSPFDVGKMDDLANQMSPDAKGDATTALDGLRGEYVSESESIGSIPIPATVKGMAKSGIDKLAGNRPELLMDKLGERAAFERGGARLYDALIAKARSAPDAGLDVSALQKIRDEEVAHFRLVSDAIEQLGGDPTAQTPCADLVGVQSMGLIQVVSDPRTTVAQSLNAMLTAELVDNAGWELLIDIATEAGHVDLAQKFEVALTEEQEHLRNVRSWLESTVLDRKMS